MKHGFLKTAAASPEIRVADCAYNAEQIIKTMRQAAAAGVRLLVLPELCVTGYTCGDLFLQSTLIEGAERAVLKIMEDSRGLSMVTVIGAPLVRDGKLYNCGVVLLDGEILGVVPKKHLPNYGEFYEKRHFTPAPDGCGEIRLGARRYPFGNKLLFSCFDMPDFCLGVEICEDWWVPSPPSAAHALAGATVLANISASNETIGKAAYRRELVKGQSARLVCGYVYADAGEGESTTDMVYSGHNLIAENGSLLNESQLFSSGLTVSEIDVGRMRAERRRLTNFFEEMPKEYQTVEFRLPMKECTLTRHVPEHPFIPLDKKERAACCEAILSMQSAGLSKRLSHTQAKTAVVGISGGLDSCLALLVAVRAMDKLKKSRSDIIAVTMPCFGTTERTRQNAVRLSKHLGVTLREIDITDSVLRHFRDIGHDEGDHSVVYENGQARERTQVLMDIANAAGGLVIGTGDLSELALGWATYNGDHMSMYGVNASVPKTLIRHIVGYAADTAKNAGLKEVLSDILNTPVSPELLPAENGEISQKTEQLVGPYELHDFFLYYIVRWGFAPSKVYRLACYAFDGKYDNKTLLYWLKNFYRRFFSQQFKRSCLPDGPKVGSVALSPRGDWRMPSDASAALWLSEIEELS